MRGHGTKFSHKMDDAVAALLTQRNIEEAARTVGISTATLMRWMKEVEFEKAYRDARRAAVRQSTARLQQATSAAATTLLKTMIDPATPASVRIRAAEAILSHSAKAIEMEDIEERVSELERAAGAPNRESEKDQR
jgi:DNA-binding MurR/RpiR family transcriptional regulator